MTTAGDIINFALRNSGVVGVGQSALPEDITDAFTMLNDMIAQWRRKRWLVFQLVSLSVVSTGAQSYTVGPGGDIDTGAEPRPNQLEAAFFRQLVQSQPNQIDYPLEIIEAREDYNNIALKQLQSFPSYIFYDSDFPLGRIFPWPIPQANIYEVFITVRRVLTSFATLATVVNLPDEYAPALRFNLARRLRVTYQMPADQELNLLAKDALSTIRGANMQVPRLQIPTDLVRPGIYNPYSDQIR